MRTICCDRGAVGSEDSSRDTTMERIALVYSIAGCCSICRGCLLSPRGIEGISPAHGMRSASTASGSVCSVRSKRLRATAIRHANKAKAIVAGGMRNSGFNELGSSGGEAFATTVTSDSMTRPFAITSCRRRSSVSNCCPNVIICHSRAALCDDEVWSRRLASSRSDASAVCASPVSAARPMDPVDLATPSPKRQTSNHRI